MIDMSLMLIVRNNEAMHHTAATAEYMYRDYICKKKSRGSVGLRLMMAVGLASTRDTATELHGRNHRHVTTLCTSDVIRHFTAHTGPLNNARPTRRAASVYN